MNPTPRVSGGRITSLVAWIEQSVEAREQHKSRNIRGESAERERQRERESRAPRKREPSCWLLHIRPYNRVLHSPIHFFTMRSMGTRSRPLKPLQQNSQSLGACSSKESKRFSPEDQAVASAKGCIASHRVFQETVLRHACRPQTLGIPGEASEIFGARFSVWDTKSEALGWVDGHLGHEAAT